MRKNDYSKITALYSRLSVGDEDRDGGESNSIQNQKKPAEPTEQEIRQLESRSRQLVQEQKAQERKDRTKRLCRRMGLFDTRDLPVSQSVPHIQLPSDS